MDEQLICSSVEQRHEEGANIPQTWALGAIVQEEVDSVQVHISILQVQVLLVQNLTEQKVKDAALLGRVGSVDFRTKLKKQKIMLNTVCRNAIPCKS